MEIQFTIYVWSIWQILSFGTILTRRISMKVISKKCWGDLEWRLTKSFEQMELKIAKDNDHLKKWTRNKKELISLH